MKRILYIALLLCISTALMSGCGAKKGPESTMTTEDYPAWVLDPSMEGGLSAVGSAKMSKAGLQFTRTEALANARDELARQMQVKVKNMVKNFTEVTGVGDAETVDKVSTQVSKQVTSQILAGSKQKKMWRSKDNELFILVALDPESAIKAAQAVKDAVTTSYKNDQALWQKFQASKAQEELDNEIEKEFGGN